MTLAFGLLQAALATTLSKPIFYDMKHSNNAARIRLWRELKPGMDDAIERRVVAYPDLKSPEFAAINPLKKVPAFIRADGTCVFESAVILNYLEDKYGDAALDRAERVHRVLALLALLRVLGVLVRRPKRRRSNGAVGAAREDRGVPRRAAGEGIVRVEAHGRRPQGQIPQSQAYVCLRFRSYSSTHILCARWPNSTHVVL